LIGSLHRLKDLRSPAVDELSTEFHWDIEMWNVLGKDASPDAVTAFQDCDRHACSCKIGRASQSSGTSADDQYRLAHLGFDARINVQDKASTSCESKDWNQILPTTGN